MALTVTNVPAANSVWGNKRARVFDITFDASYPDDGESLTPADLGLKVVEQLIVHGPFIDAGNDNGILVTYDLAEQKLVAIWGNAGTASVMPEVTATTSLAAYSGRVTAVGY